MSPRGRRILIPLLVGGIAFGLVLAVVFLKAPPPAPASGQSTPPGSSTPSAASGSPQDPAADPAPDPTSGGVAQNPDTTTDPDEAPPESVAGGTLDADTRLRARTPVGSGDPAAPLGELGSLDPRDGALHLQFVRVGAGIDAIVCSDLWDTAAAKHAADAHYDALDAGSTNPPPLPNANLRYVISSTQVYAEPTTGRQIEIPVLAAHNVTINGKLAHLFLGPDGEPVWAEIAPGSFATEIVDQDDRVVARITRTYELGARNDILMRQHIENGTTAPLQVRWTQYGPADLFPDRAKYLDRRRLRFGYLRSTADPMIGPVLSDKNLLLERRDILKQEDSIWPNDTSRDQGYVLSWFASTNRYFALAVHPVLDASGQGNRALTAVQEIGYAPVEDDSSVIFTYLFSPTLTVAAGQTASLDMGVYAGPMDRHVLADKQPYMSLRMKGLVLYQMSSCCSACTFQWLAVGLISFLDLAVAVLGDWGLAIILLVCIVRVLLHPLTKKSQVSMQMFSKQMQNLKPEIDKLQQKYQHEPKKMQAEQLRLFREHGVNPLQFLGCLPMFLQMPIWIALYAMLYFAFDIRHEPAFYGVFQAITGGAWPFLADLSAADRFIPLRADPLPKSFMGFYFDFSSINLLPLLMGFLFYIQQKYMTPPPSPTMTKEQIQQQKIMKILFPLMMPVILYSAPSGLTLYILTSSTLGILESRYIRAHIKDMDVGPGTSEPGSTTKKKKSRDATARAYNAMLARMEEKRRLKQQPKKSYKKRKK